MQLVVDHTRVPRGTAASSDSRRAASATTAGLAPNRNQYEVEVCGFEHGYVGRDQLEGLPARIREAGAEIVLVALGNPRQESWIAQHAAATNASLLLGVGAFLDFLTGTMPRAPRWIRRARLEWAYRLYLEPKRLWQRYLLDPFALAAAAALQRARHGLRT